MTVLLCVGDWHAGKSASLYEGRLAEQEHVYARILDLARERNVDAVLHAGDMWEHRKPTPAEYLAVERPLVRHRAENGPPVEVCCGNHDRSGADASLALHVLEEAGLIRLSTVPEVITLPCGVTLATLPWTPVAHLVADAGGGDRDDINAYAAELLVEAARGLRGQVDGPAVLLGHWSVSGAALPSGLDVGMLREPVLPAADLLSLGFDAVVMGHIHKPQRLDGEDAAFYVGSPMPLDFGEASVDHGVWILESHDMGPVTSWSPEFLPVESRPFVTIEIDPDYVGVDTEAVDGAVVWARVRGPSAAGFDVRDLRHSLDVAGAHYARVTVDVEPAARQSRGAVISDDDGPVELLDQWLRDVAGVNGDEGARLVDRGRAYLEGVS